ncbi:MAG: 3-demethylubiquinone-9 3-O-methyltransferase [Leptolyngbyaceae cyanobacterium SL_1_1]|nr:3-demethylubiquinone-9 3-O-methyltransferase [Leptolyngbyaceae cyanobacterium SL_1_1]
MKLKNDLGFYDRQAADWWQPSAKVYALHQLNPLRFRFFDRYVSSWQGLSVLDVGCGGGYTCEFLAERGALVCGIDQSAACIEAARQHASSPIVYGVGAAEHLPYGDRQFDVVTCVDVLEHVDDLAQTLSEIRRVLKPAGLFCFDTVNRTWRSKLIMIWLLENILREIPTGVHDWQKFITPAELTSHLSSIGFTQVEMRGFNLFGSKVTDTVTTYWHYRRTGRFQISFDADTSVMYIGVAGSGLAWSG